MLITAYCRHYDHEQTVRQNAQFVVAYCAVGLHATKIQGAWMVGGSGKEAPVALFWIPFDSKTTLKDTETLYAWAVSTGAHFQQETFVFCDGTTVFAVHLDGNGVASKVPISERSTASKAAVEAAFAAPSCTVNFEGFITPGSWGASLLMTRHGVYIPVSNPK